MILFYVISVSSYSQPLVLSVDSCRQLAVKNNKTLKIYNERIRQSDYTKRSARANFLPQLSVAGTYMYNSRDLQLMSDENVEKLGTGIGGSVAVLSDYVMKNNPDLLPSLLEMKNIEEVLQDINHVDIHNIFAGMVVLEQPIFMGGKIAAYYRITKYYEMLNESRYDTQKQKIAMDTDKAYWLVVSLTKKKAVAEEYIKYINQLLDNVNKMLIQGVATKSDQLTVEVKQNEANVMLQKVSDGIVLARMSLAKLCGLPLDTDIITLDEANDNINKFNCEQSINKIDMANVFANRDELRSLSFATKIRKKQVALERAEILPQIGLLGTYSITNPNLFNGFEKNFKGGFSVGVSLKMPVWSWGKHTNKVNAAKSQVLISEWEEAEAKEMITLQVRSAAFNLSQDEKTLITARTNINKADENLRNAQLGFQEGVLTTQNVLEAQTAWLLSNSELVDAMINVRLSDIYYNMAIGNRIY